jgi:hypothetical protein
MSSLWRSDPPKGQLGLPAAKRISTPAGQRLSVVLENGDNAKPKEAHKSILKKGLLPAFGDVPRESLEDQSRDSGYSYSVWSENSGEKLNGAGLRNNKHVSKRGGWKRLALIAAIILLIIIAVVVGVVVGTRKKGSSSKDDRYVTRSAVHFSILTFVEVTIHQTQQPRPIPSPQAQRQYPQPQPPSYHPRRRPTSPWAPTAS